MTIQEVLDQTDAMRPNMMPREMKIRFLQELDQLIYREILLKHQHTEEEEVLPEYGADVDEGTALLVPDPYSDVYPKYLLTQIDRQNQEDGRYNVDRAQFENAYDTMSDWWTREHMPLQRVREFRI